MDMWNHSIGNPGVKSEERPLRLIHKKKDDTTE
jgi:hypothetical protein